MSTRKQPEIFVAADVASLVENAARRVLAHVTAAGPRIAICLTGGSTPKPLYRRLIEEPYRSSIPWDRIHWFWGDDRLVPHNDERSNAGMARAAFLDHMPVPPANIHYIPTNFSSPHEAALRYEDDLKQFYGRDQLDPDCPLFDLVLTGLGSDGHTASLFPGSASLSETRRWAVGTDEAGLAPFVSRITLTFPALASTRELMFLVSSPDKRDVVDRVLSGQDLPAARAYANGRVLWMLDRDAAPERYPSFQTET
jgi:6-phosphogluconolactonase